jgi:hypothetical protein
MKPRFIVTPAINEATASLTEFNTDMLLLGCFEDAGRGPVEAFDSVTGGHLSTLLTARKFSGKLGTRFAYETEGGAQKFLLVVGLGQSARFDCKAISRVLGIAINKAFKHRCEKLSIPFFHKRFGAHLNLATQAQITHEAAVVKLGDPKLYPENGELTIELVCLANAQAERRLNEGLRRPLTGLICCNHVDSRAA